jgi:hypothetical protein
LTDVTINSEMLKIFDLGIKCHLKTKVNHLSKKIELEKLYENIKSKEEKSEIIILNDEERRTDLK